MKYFIFYDKYKSYFISNFITVIVITNDIVKYLLVIVSDFVFDNFY